MIMMDMTMIMEIIVDTITRKQVQIQESSVKLKQSRAGLALATCGLFELDLDT